MRIEKATTLTQVADFDNSIQTRQADVTKASGHQLVMESSIRRACSIDPTPDAFLTRYTVSNLLRHLAKPACKVRPAM